MSVALLKSLQQFVERHVRDLEFQRYIRDENVQGNLNVREPLSGTDRTLRRTAPQSAMRLSGIAPGRPVDDFFNNNAVSGSDPDPDFGVDPERPLPRFRKMADDAMVLSRSPRVFVGYLPEKTKDALELAPYIRIYTEKTGYVDGQVTDQVVMEFVIYNSHDDGESYFDLANMVDVVMEAMASTPCQTLGGRFVLQDGISVDYYDRDPQARGWLSASMVTKWSSMGCNLRTEGVLVK